jgi:indolepyruvate ferredoxin oxidoreductase beta subunit
VLIGKDKYPENINEGLKAAVENTIIVAASEIAEGLGNIKAQNVVLLGALIKALKLTYMNWEEAIENTVPPKAIELNKKALAAGIEA